MAELALPHLHHQHHTGRRHRRRLPPPTRQHRTRHPRPQKHHRPRPPASGNFAANAAWGTCATLAHNLYRWINAHTTRRRRGQLTAARTIRNQLLALPGRLVNHAGRTILRLPARWPWAPTFHTTLTNIRNLPQLC